MHVATYLPFGPHILLSFHPSVFSLFFTVPLSRHNHKQVSEVYSLMYQKFPHNRESLIQSSCFVTWCHNRARKYSVPCLQHLAVRTSQRYDLTSWSSRPLWWNAVIQEICEAKGAPTLLTLPPYALCLRRCAWLLSGVEQCLWVGFCIAIV